MADFEIITAEELKEKLDGGEDFVLIDVLSRESYDAKHIPGSISIPGGEGFSEKVQEEVPDKFKEIVVYCASETCQASPTAARALVEMGYENVYDFEDGLAGWSEAGYDFE